MSVLSGGLSDRQDYLPYSTVPQQPAFDPLLSSIKMWPGPLHHHVQCRTSGSFWFSIVFDEAMTGLVLTTWIVRTNCRTVLLFLLINHHLGKWALCSVSARRCILSFIGKWKVLLQVGHLTVFISQKLLLSMNDSGIHCIILYNLAFLSFCFSIECSWKEGTWIICPAFGCIQGGSCK